MRRHAWHQSQDHIVRAEALGRQWVHTTNLREARRYVPEVCRENRVYALAPVAMMRLAPAQREFPSEVHLLVLGSKPCTNFAVLEESKAVHTVALDALVPRTRFARV